MSEPSDDDVPLDCVLVGAGVAGVSAALWLLDYDLSFAWVAADDARVGGILHRVNNPLRNVAAADYPNGRALAASLAEQVAARGLDPRAARVTRVTPGAKAHAVELDDGESLHARTVILATGTAPRALGVPGEAELMGARVSTSGTRDGGRFAGQRVAVVGGGDGGFENALILAERHGCQVDMLLRSRTHRARDGFVERARRHHAITLHPAPTSILSIEDLGGAARLHLDTPSGNASIEVACLFVKIGFGPRLPELIGVDDPTGFVSVDAHQRSSTPGIFAAGDVVDHPLRAVSRAAGQGASAAFSVAHHLGAFGRGKEPLG